MRLFSALVVLLLAPTASAGELTLGNGEAGLYGKPYAFLGPQDGKDWEVYRKRVFTKGNPPPVTATNPTPERVLFKNVLQCYECDAKAGIYLAPGLVAARSEGHASPPRSQLYLVRFVDSKAAAQPLELRLGFMEGPDGVASFVTGHGGDDGGSMDLSFGKWGVDGLYQRWIVSVKDSHWLATGCGAFRVGRDEDPLEDARVNYCKSDVKAGASPIGPADVVETGLPSDKPLAISWRIQTVQQQTLLVVTFHQTNLIWLVDDGGTIDGLRQTHNVSTPSGYEGGGFDLAHAVPVFFAGGADAPTLPTDGHTAEFGLFMASPELDAPAKAFVGEPAQLKVTMLGGDGQVADGFVGRVHLSCTPGGPDEDIDFKVQEAGVHLEPVTFAAAGTVQCAASDPYADLGVSPATIQVVERGHADLAVSAHLESAEVLAGEPVEVSVFVTNNLGPDDAQDVRVDLTLPDGSVCREILGPGWTCQCTNDTSASCLLPLLSKSQTSQLTLRADAPLATGTVQYQAHAFATEIDPTPADNTAILSVTVEAPPAAEVQLTATPVGEALPGDRIALLLDVKNHGTAPLTQVEVQLRLPVGTALIAGTEQPVRASLPGTTVLDQIAPGGIARFGFQVTVLADAPASLSASATFSAQAMNPVSRALEIPVATMADLTLGSDARGVQRGDSVLLSGEIRSARLCQDATLVLSLSIGLSLVTGSVQVGHDVAAVAQDGAKVTVPLPKGVDPIAISLTAKVAQDAQASQLVEAQVVCGSRPGSDKASVEIPLLTTFLLGGCSTGGGAAPWLLGLLTLGLWRRRTL